MSEERVVEHATVENAELIRFLYADNDGVIRGKATTLPLLGRRMRSGIGHTVGMMAMSMLDHLQPVEGAGPVGEVRIVPDPSTFTMLPYAPGAAAMCSDLVRLDGRPWEACARTFLKDAVAKLAADGTTLRAAFEPEFTLGHRVPGPAGGPDRL
jgi:glutamine synthetase